MPKYDYPLVVIGAGAGGLVIAMVIFSYTYDLHEKISVESIRDFIKGLGYFGLIIYMCAYAFTSIILFPASLLSIASGVVWSVYIYGYWCYYFCYSTIFPCPIFR